jgi:hypothetical protein
MEFVGAYGMVNALTWDLTPGSKHTFCKKEKGLP